MSTDGTHRSSRLANLLVIAAWIAVAVIANSLVALTPGASGNTSSALLPQDARNSTATKRIAEAFPGTGTNAIAYLMLDGRDALGPADQQYYDAAVSALRADTRHVGSVLDWWADPLTAPLGTGPDDRSAIAVVWLVGQAGTDQARESLAAARTVVRDLPPSVGLRARIVVPATTVGMPVHMTAWQGAVLVTAAALIAGLLLLRARRSRLTVGIALLTAALSLAVTWPLAALARRDHGATLSAFAVFSTTLAAVLAIGTITASVVLVSRLRSDTGAPALVPLGRRAYRDSLPALALPAACVALLTGPLLLARTPALHSVGMATLGVVVALAASVTLLPALLGLAGQPSSSQSDDAAPTRASSIPRAAVVTAVVLAICAVPVIGMRFALAENPAGPAATSTTRSLPWNPLPDVVVIEAANDLRDPAGLIAIDQVSHRLMEIPGVRKVESAAWPAGVPWQDASLTAAAGKLSDQLDRGAGSFMPQVTAIKTLGSIVNQMSGAVDQLDTSVQAGLAGAAQIQQNVELLLSGTRNIKGLTVELSGYLDPVRGYVGGVENCPADMLCTAARKVVDPVDRVVDDVTLLSDGADRIAAVSRRTVGAFATAPQVMAQMRSALAQLQSFVPNLETTIQDTLPQLVQVSAFLRNLRLDFASTGEGGFYLSGKAIADPSYQHVRQTMFSSQGTVTRLLVYSDRDKLDLGAATRAQQLEIAAGKAMKYGSLVDGKVTVSGAAQMAADVRGALTHDAVLLALVLLAVVLAVSMWRGALGGVVVGVGMLLAYLAALGISIALWQDLVGSPLQASVPLVSFAALLTCGIPYLIAGLVATDEGAAGATPVRRAFAPLAALSAVFGVGLVLVSGGSISALSQVGTVLVAGVGALMAVAHVCVPAAMQDRTRGIQADRSADSAS
ncbi:MMPL family transporter [Mycobacterium basiliense]|uniref:MMPL family transporter n=1 Tax=Mycobacterium basiliense TaxID=2094119 RepID=UPI0013012171|nr:MMPL family transporter [Mycobacterium basiliense]